MNDELKFRVWIKDAECYFEQKNKLGMICVDYLGRKIFLKWHRLVNCFHSASLSFSQRQYIIERCTGLRDKNGKLIFKGDIFIGDADRYCLVTWKDGGFGFMLEANTPPGKYLADGKDWYNFIPFSGHPYLDDILSRIAVITNIHEYKKADA